MVDSGQDRHALDGLLPTAQHRQAVAAVSAMIVRRYAASQEIDRRRGDCARTSSLELRISRACWRCRRELVLLSRACGWAESGEPVVLCAAGGRPGRWGRRVCRAGRPDRSCPLDPFNRHRELRRRRRQGCPGRRRAGHRRGRRRVDAAQVVAAAGRLVDPPQVDGGEQQRDTGRQEARQDHRLNHEATTSRC
jgi:hypothetical protein